MKQFIVLIVCIVGLKYWQFTNDALKTSLFFILCYGVMKYEK